MGWFVIAPHIRIMRKFTIKHLPDYVAALVHEFWNDEFDEEEELGGTWENAAEITTVCLALCAVSFVDLFI